MPAIFIGRIWLILSIDSGNSRVGFEIISFIIFLFSIMDSYFDYMFYWEFMLFY